MPDNGYIARMVVVSAGITWALRALPFAALAPLRASRAVTYLGLHMPVGVMVILAIYTVGTVVGETKSHVLWLIIAVAVTAGLHVWRSQALLSILVGTACYVTLMTVWG